MKKLSQILLLALFIAAPAAISAQQVQANPVTNQSQVTKAASKSGTTTKKHRYKKGGRTTNRMQQR